MERLQRDWGARAARAVGAAALAMFASIRPVQAADPPAATPPQSSCSRQHLGGIRPASRYRLGRVAASATREGVTTIIASPIRAISGDTHQRRPGPPARGSQSAEAPHRHRGTGRHDALRGRAACHHASEPAVDHRAIAGGQRESITRGHVRSAQLRPGLFAKVLFRCTTNCRRISTCRWSLSSLLASKTSPRCSRQIRFIRPLRPSPCYYKTSGQH